MSWSPDSDSSSGGWAPEPEPGDARPEVVLLTSTAFRLRLAAVPHERAGPGEQAFATYLADVSSEVPEDEVRPIAVGMLPAETFAALAASGLFAEPAPLMLRAGEAEDGQLRGVLSALFSRAALERLARRMSAADEPWAASLPDEPDPIPGVDGAGERDDESADALMPFALGVVLRFAENRKHRDDLAAEATDLFTTILSEGAMDADAKKIDNLISGL
jgi:hypothetical protein